MKRIMLTIAALGILSVFVASAMAHDGRNPNIVQVNQRYYGGHHGGYSGGYHGGWNGYRVYYPPGWGYPTAVTRFPPHPPMFPPPVYRSYRHYPSSGFYYNTPGFSVGVGF